MSKKIVVYAEGPELVNLTPEDEAAAETIFMTNFNLAKLGFLSPPEVFIQTIAEWREAGYVVEDPTGFEARVLSLV